MEKKDQHFVPRSYIAPWCDPATPTDQEPYVWRFEHDGSNPRRKAPANIFSDTDTYTILMPDGSRNLVIENGLASLESKYVDVRKKLIAGQTMTDEEYVILCGFVAAMTARTKSQRTHWQNQWGQVLEMMNRMIDAAPGATEQEKARMRTTGQYPMIKALTEKPLQHNVPIITDQVSPILFKMDFALFESDDEVGFITSDTPCVWFDPEWHKQPPFYRGVGLAVKTTEVTLPLTPTLIACFGWRGVKGRLKVPIRVVDELNRRTRFEADEYFVVNKNFKKEIWFDKGIEPPDSWDNTHGRENSPDHPPTAAPKRYE